MPIKFKAQASGDLEIELYDVIGFWGTNAKDFSQRIKAAKGKNITLRINSPGGSVTDGTAIYNLLKQHTGKVTAQIDGIAASMAGVIAMAASTVIMPDNTFIMIHNPSAFGDGESEDLRKMAELLDKMKENLITAYEAKSGADRKDIAKWMDDTSWFTAAECLELGLCDEVVNSVEAAAFASACDYFPGRFVNAAKPIPPVTTNGGQENQPQNTMTKEEQAAFDAANGKVATLETAATNSAKAHASALENATATALQTATTNENKRKADIKAIAAKYNVKGDLDAVTIEALSGVTTPEAFKDSVLEVVAKRGTKPAQRADVTTTGKNKGKDATAEDEELSEEDKFIADYEACKNDRDRMTLVRSNRALARRVQASGKLADRE